MGDAITTTDISDFVGMETVLSHARLSALDRWFNGRLLESCSLQRYIDGSVLNYFGQHNANLVVHFHR